MGHAVSSTTLVSPHRIPNRPGKAVVISLLCSLLLALRVTIANAQHLSTAVLLATLPADGVLLNEGWRFRPGDDLTRAQPDLDDRQWVRIDPTKDIRQLPQLQQAGIGWLRLHLITGADLPPVLVHVFQSVASEVYLDGHLLYRFGTVSSHSDRVEAYNPSAAFSLPLRASTQHVLALRIAIQPGLHLSKLYLPWDAAALQLRVLPSTVIPAIGPTSLQATQLDTFRVGIAFILFILHLSLFLAYRTHRANAYAAVMYGLLCVSFLARTLYNSIHSVDDRLIIQYVSFLDAWVPSVAILIFYSLFQYRKSWFFWLALTSGVVRFIPFPPGNDWIHVAVAYYQHGLLCWLSVVASRRRLLGARIIQVGVLCNLGLLPAFSLLGTLDVRMGEHEWLYHTLYLLSFLCIPLTLSLRLAMEHGWVNRQLMVRLKEVETLSARNLAQQLERQNMLARQNEQLEEQVAERTRELHQKADQLRELDQVKSRFVNNLTHEFRTPLSLILSPVEKLLQEKRYDGPLLTAVHRNAGQLLRLINQLLDLSKLESKFMAVSLVQGEVPDFIHQIMAVFQRAAEQKNVTLTAVVDEFSPQTHVFDADKWEKILTNLLANALKFTPAGGRVDLTLKPLWLDAVVTGVSIEITDSGVGIGLDQLPHIFDRFYQADTSLTRSYEGTGIGLALVYELIQLLGGTVTVASEPGVGTTFSLTLPVQPALMEGNVPPNNGSTPFLWAVDSMAVPLPAPVPSLVDADRPSILIVEDNDELRAFLVGELSGFYQVFQASDGEEGWATTQTELPDVVLTDVMMPRRDGYALTQLIKANANTDHIAVVMLTAKTAQESRMEGLQQGADDYLAKPFSVAELQLRLHNLIFRQRALGEHFRRQFALPIATDLPVARPGGLLSERIAPGENPFLNQIYALLDKHLDDPAISVDWLADKLVMNRKTLYRKVKSLIQLAPADLIRQYRLRKAADLLRAGNNVSETADLVGFSTQSHFAIVFKDFYHQTPSEYIATQLKQA